MLICSKCKAAIVEGSKFCPQCGDPVTKEDVVKEPALQHQIANAEISFGYSSSPNYQNAVSICLNIPSYRVDGEGRQTKHQISLPITEVDLIINLYELVGSWKSSKMLINGTPATKKNLIYHGVGCFRNQRISPNPSQFCYGEYDYDINIWGCKKINMPISEYGGGWLDYGEFDKSGIWFFDKERIKNELGIGIKENELCPILKVKNIYDTLKAIPESINPKKDKGWSYRTEYEEVGDDYKDIVVGIIPDLNKMDHYAMGDFKPEWDIDTKEASIGFQGSGHMMQKVSKGIKKFFAKINTKNNINRSRFTALNDATKLFEEGLSLEEVSKHSPLSIEDLKPNFQMVKTEREEARNRIATWGNESEIYKQAEEMLKKGVSIGDTVRLSELSREEVIKIKEGTKGKSAETKLDRVIENVLRANNMDIKETVAILGVKKKDVKAIAKKIKQSKST